MKSQGKKSVTARAGTVYRRLEEVIGCKWSVSVLMAVLGGITRPGALERQIAGISTKVLAERLRKLTRYGLLTREALPEMPPHTEYALTSTGQELVRIIAQIQALDGRLGGTSAGAGGPPDPPGSGGGNKVSGP